jgi:MFS family permease
MNGSKPASGRDAYAVLKIRDYRFFMTARFFLTFAIQMQSVIVGWQIYEHTHDALSLGLIGLAEAIPFLFVALFSGHIADVIERKKIIIATVILYFLSSLALLIITYRFTHIIKESGVYPIYAIIFITGIARGFLFPAQSAFVAQIVPRELYANSSTWNSTIWHIAAISGPAFGGLIYGFFGINVAYLVVVIFVVIALVAYSIIKKRPLSAKEKKETLLQSLTAGGKFVFKNQIILGALSLDMLAVLFGGATALLPIFAGDILKVGPQGLGMLRAAPAFGAVIMAMILAYHPPLENAGKKLLFSVAGFGFCIIAFAISNYFILSLVLLAMSGMFDNVSVIIRGTILQLATPDEMRGRVSAINSIFVGSSNEIGSFESGLAAKLMGLVPSVIFGGAMTVLVVISIAKKVPKLRHLNLNSFLN